MKYCSRPYEYLYLDDYNGDVYLCPWMEPKKCCIGNILKDDIQTIWHGEQAEYFRNKFRKNCYEHCRNVACPHIQNNDLKEITDDCEWEKLTKAEETPLVINMAFDEVCNQHCETCRKGVFVPPQNYGAMLDKIKERIVPYLNKAKMFTASGHGDPFASPYMMNVLSEVQPEREDVTILLETNGVFFDEEHWERIKHFEKYNLKIVLTSNSFDRWTYEHISLGGNYDKLMHNLGFIKTLRAQNIIKEYTSSFVIQDRNFREIPSFIKRSLEEFGFDNVVLKPVYQWGTMPEKTYWFKDVLNPMHPYHREYLEILKDPIMKDKRVYNFGGDTEHPARDFEIVNECCCCNCEEKKEEKKEVKEKKSVFAKMVSLFKILNN